MKSFFLTILILFTSFGLWAFMPKEIRREVIGFSKKLIIPLLVAALIAVVFLVTALTTNIKVI